MRNGFITIVIVGIALIATGIGSFKLFSGHYEPPNNKPVASPNLKQNEKSQKGNTKSPNDTSKWIFFSSELYKYSLKYPNNFKIIVGNKNIFQANSKDYKEENGVVTTGAITQVIAADTSDSFDDAWGNIETKLKNQFINILDSESTLVNGEKAYKIKLKNLDGTIEIRYLTYKAPYSYKISVLIGRDSTADTNQYEQILDDIISTFNF